MEYFINTAHSIPEYLTLLEEIRRGGLPSMMTGLSHIHKAHMLAALAADSGKTLLAVADSEGEAVRLCADINAMTGEETALAYPAKDLTLADVDVVSKEYEHRRINVLHKLITGKCRLAVASPEACMQLTIPAEVLKKRTVVLNSGDDIVLSEVISTLVAAGFSRCDQIEGASQFSVRGSILDIYPVNFPAPVRIELWGDNIDNISTFDLETQRRIDTVKSVTICPSVELMFDSADVLSERLQELADKTRGKNAETVRKRIRKDIERLKSGLSVTDSDKYFPLCYDEEATLFDYTDSVIVCENAGCAESARAAWLQHSEDLKLLFEEGVLCKRLDRYMLTKNEYGDRISEKCVCYMENFLRGGGLSLGKLINTSAVQLSPWSGAYKTLLDEVRDYIGKGFGVLVFAGTEKAARVLCDDLRRDNVLCDFSAGPSKVYAKRVYVTPGTLSAGYSYPEAKLAMLTHTAVSSGGKLNAPAAKKRKKAEIINSLNDIAIGDLVVHNSYGIGVFEGVQKLTTDKISKDYIKLKFAGTDVLYVPVTQLDLVSRYIGNADAATVKLSKLHTDQWQRAKTKAKAAAKEMAAELIELYAKRLNSKGHAFDRDGAEQEDFENHFSYVETDDQMRCIAEIKHDMEREIPMERLLCGDVGFGKTEVALRGAFKCIMGGKQCALLCPTTVLAWQHYQTVLKRMDGFPVNIELLSRFRTAKEVKVILEKLKKGTIDMVIGTHRLVQDDVEFKNLGLVIIDEEQRFGVTHKDKFKENFSGVDILTLSATPIPRTLNMAMSGIRDMSVIETPPQDRQPVTTYVMEHDDGMIANAIMKELRRNGQVYYIHNRIESIMQCAAKLHEQIPEAKIGIAHGRMTEDELLEVWQKLLEQEIDVLVCTTLIETGVDVPNCNTLIIENADYMGLAQLHQLRGRVGRTNRRAFAYFTFKRGKVLSEIASKRLDAIREFTKFGSGFRIAMRDLEIRGAGSILGQSQSGHMSAVGYDMYVKLLNEAVAEERNEPVEEKPECLVDVKIDAYIPQDYISNQAQRIICYKKIAQIQNDDDAYDVTDELIDRYGELPTAVYGLIEVAQLRNMAQKSGITEIVQNGDTISFYVEKPDMKKVSALTAQLDGRVQLNLVGRISMKIKLKASEKPLEIMREILSNY